MKNITKKNGFDPAIPGNDKSIISCWAINNNISKEKKEYIQMFKEEYEKYDMENILFGSFEQTSKEDILKQTKEAFNSGKIKYDVEEKEKCYKNLRKDWNILHTIEL